MNDQTSNWLLQRLAKTAPGYDGMLPQRHQVPLTIGHADAWFTENDWAGKG